MPERQVVTMFMQHFGTPRDQEARVQLAAALPDDAEVRDPDEIGIFDVVVEADDREDALHRVWNAVAASGTDDHILFLEHPDLPEHWRPRSGRPDARDPTG
jgi:hypothetical protein